MKGNICMRFNTCVNTTLDAFCKTIEFIPRPIEISCDCVPQNRFTGSVYMIDAVVGLFNIRKHSVRIIVVGMKFCSLNFSAQRFNVNSQARINFLPQ